MSINPKLYFDIETIPDLRPGAKDRIAESITPPKSMSRAETIAKWEAEERPAAIEQAWRKTSLDGAKGQIAVISAAFEDAPPATFYFADLAKERAVIEAFFEFCRVSLAKLAATGGSLRPILVGHNHAGFDLPFVFKRCVVLGVRPPWWFPINPKPWDDHVFDTMVAWAGKGYARMDDVCEALGIEGKGSEFGGEEDIDGSRVWDYVRDGKIDIVAKYCAGDVERTREMYRRMTFAGL